MGFLFALISAVIATTLIVLIVRQEWLSNDKNINKMFRQTDPETENDNGYSDDEW